MIASYIDELRGRLARLQRMSRSAFAAAIAQRLVNSATDATDIAQVRRVLNSYWSYLLGKPFQLAELERLSEDPALVIVDEEADPNWAVEHALATDAASAIAYALESLRTDDPRPAAWAAEQPLGWLDLRISS